MGTKFKVRIDKDRCKGCLLCVEACARGLLKLARKLNSQGQRYVEIECDEECRGCKQCAEICPDAAIEIDRLPSHDEEIVAKPDTVPAGAARENA